MANELALTINQRNALSSIRSIDRYLSITERRLATGKEISSVVDGPVKYFVGRELSQRASNYLEHVEEQEQAIQALEATVEALETVDNLLDQALGIISGARSQSQAMREQASLSLAETLRQINLTLTDPTYLGTNLLTSANNSLTVRLSKYRVDHAGQTFDAGLMTITANDLRTRGGNALFGQLADFLQVALLNPTASKRTNTQVIPMFDQGGFQPQAGTDFLGLTQMGAANTFSQTIYVAFDKMFSDAKDRLEAVSAGYGNAIALLNERISFSQTYSDTIQIGADKVILADMNEEGANLTALRARNQISIETLSIASQQLAAVLTLLQ